MWFENPELEFLHSLWNVMAEKAESASLSSSDTDFSDTENIPIPPDFTMPDYDECMRKFNNVKEQHLKFKSDISYLSSKEREEVWHSHNDKVAFLRLRFKPKLKLYYNNLQIRIIHAAVHAISHNVIDFPNPEETSKDLHFILWHFLDKGLNHSYVYILILFELGLSRLLYTV